MNEKRVSRRTFLRTSASAAVISTAVGTTHAAPAPLTQRGANNRLRIGFVGVGGRGFGAHVRTLSRFQEEGSQIELAAVSDVFAAYRERASAYIKEKHGNTPAQYVDYRDMYAKEDLDAVCISTPDHWHAKQILDALDSGKHVYCEKPMTKTVEEALEVERRWKQSGKVMQVGVQSTSLPVWRRVREELCAGKIGKVLMYQTEFFRNSSVGQWRYYELTEDMTPETVNWKLWLGVEEGLAEEIPFDRAIFRQWRRFWAFGAGMYSDLFVHRTTAMLKATGLRFPGRVVGSGGIYLEYDGRDVPDVATVIAEFPEGVQGLVTATMCNQGTPIPQLIRGHYGSFVFGNGEEFSGFDFVPEPSTITHLDVPPERIEVEPKLRDTTRAHFANWLEAVEAGKPEQCNNPPDLGAAAIVVVNLGARSYQEGKVFHFEPETRTVLPGSEEWAKRWEQMSKDRAKPKHIPGWHAGDTGSTLEGPDYMALAGPWIDGKPPEARR
ncbi:MAG TPA: Gfo/Idh/MocA family oxidoreductase [Acidobacteriota bacterium]|nr:Gfo/Idh/MocA family oxidoreductase [Acidobacteriota bacterium]